jgi:hypothetical protein
MDMVVDHVVTACLYVRRVGGAVWIDIPPEPSKRSAPVDYLTSVRFLQDWRSHVAKCPADMTRVLPPPTHLL